MNDIVRLGLTDDLMLFLWATVTIASVFVATRNGLPRVLVLALPGVAWFLFYVWVHYDLWSSVNAAVAWSRVAHTVTVTSILYALWTMYRASSKTWN